MVRMGVARRVDLIFAALVIIGASVATYRSSGAPSGPAPSTVVGKSIPFTDTNVDGQPQAPVVVIEYSDFQCPFCRAFVSKTLPALRERYIKTGKVRLAFRHLPLSSIHAHARAAAEGAECAAEQRRFWPMHDRLFSRTELNPSRISELARDTGINADTFNKCITDRTTTRVDRDIASAADLGIAATPTFLIGLMENTQTVKIFFQASGAIPYEEMARLIDKAYK